MLNMKNSLEPQSYFREGLPASLHMPSWCLQPGSCHRANGSGRLMNVHLPRDSEGRFISSTSDEIIGEGLLFFRRRRVPAIADIPGAKIEFWLPPNGNYDDEHRATLKRTHRADTRLKHRLNTSPAAHHSA
jgi:hypothetical protein